MECPELKKILDQIEGNVIPLELKAEIDRLFETDKNCRAGYAQFLQIEQILQNTVYGEMDVDKHLAYMSHLAGRHLRYQTVEEHKQEKARNKFHFSAAKILGFILVAAAIGTVSALIVGLMRMDSTQPVTVEINDSLASEIRVIQGDEVRRIPVPGLDKSSEALPADSDVTINPAKILEKLDNLETELDRQDAAREDTVKLEILEAELAALRDALSRSPRDRDLVSRTMEAYRKVIDQRRKLALQERVRDYYNLGYLHYNNREYPQAAIITDEGIRNVRIGPTEYLHYLKALSYFRMAEKGSIALPADYSQTPEARVAGESMRASLDREARRKAVNDLRRAISEFTKLLGNPELESSATNWILKCNDMIKELSNPAGTEDSTNVNTQP